MKFCICIIIVLSIFCSCSIEQNMEQGQKLSLENNKDMVVGYDDIFKKSSIIPLDNNSKCYLKVITKVEVFNTDIYVAGGVDENRLFVFNRKGKFLRQIGEVGHGHGEFSHVSDFAIDKTNNRVIILDAPSKIHIYDLSGKYLLSKDLKESSFWNIVWHNNEFVLTTNNFGNSKDDYLLYFYNDKFELKDKYVNVLPFAVGAGSTLSSVLQVDNNTIYYIDNATRSIYTYDEKEKQIEKSYQWILPNPMPSEYYGSFEKFGGNQHKFDFIFDAIISNKNILVSYIHDNKYYIKMFSSAGKAYRNGIVLGGLPSMFKGEKDNVILAVSAYDYLRDKTKKYPKIKVSLEDNYLLVNCKLK